MGQRANYVIVENGKVDLRYSHWTANTLDRDLFWGPEWALAFIRRQEPTKEWLDDRWCEGAALVDLDRKVLLLFGGEDIKLDPPLRRVYLGLLQSVWSGWTVRWAFEGLLEIAEHVGVARAVVLAAREERRGSPPGPAGDWTQSVASVRWEDGRIGVYSLGCTADYLVQYGADLLDVLRRIDRPPRLLGLLRRRETHDSLLLRADCSGGLHLEVASRRLDFWLAAPRPEARERARRRWPGWSVEWHHDAFEDHCALTDQKLVAEVRPEETLLDEAIAILEHQPARHHGESALEIAELLSRHEGKPVEVNPAALVDAPQAVPAEVRQQILDKARSSFLRR